jgi:predicted enzyme related to lactoylglutathione lyase
VDRIHDVMKRIVPSGGTIIKAAYPEADLWIAIIRDPAGNLIGLWQDGNR